MRKALRLISIIDYIKINGSITLKKICNKYNVSRYTACRDLNDLSLILPIRYENKLIFLEELK